MSLPLRLRPQLSAPATSLCSMSSHCPTPTLLHSYVDHLVSSLSHVLHSQGVAAVFPRGAEDHARIGVCELDEDG